jgi:hypothetical protein
MEKLKKLEKHILSFLSLLLFSGCAILGTNMIHSPISEEGTSWKHRNVHGGATKNAPPESIIFKVNDSTSIIVGARTVWEKKNFGGILFPIFPIFWFPKIDFYKDQPNSLFIEVSKIGQGNAFEIISATIKSNRETFEFIKVGNSSVFKELGFCLNAEETNEFKLVNLTLKIDDKPIEIPSIKFQKMKQRWRFFGP